MISIILREGWEDKTYIGDKCHGFDRITWAKITASTSTVLPKTAIGDRLTGIPFHRYVPCRVEASSDRRQQLKMIDSGQSDIMVCGRTLDVFFEDIKRFHGFLSPGVVLGGFMVDWAQELIGPDLKVDAIVETCYCLPDAVQIFTPCTIGNGWLNVLDWDKFALSLYDKRKLTGYRIWLDPKKASLFPKIDDWYMRRKSKEDFPSNVLIEEIINARRSVLSYRAIHVARSHKRKRKWDIALCSACGEAYSTSQGARCTACQGGGYYTL